MFNDEHDDEQGGGHDEEHGWHAHLKAQHAFSNGNGESDDRDGIGVAERLNPENWIELTDQLAQFPAYDPDLSAGDTVEGLWGGTPPVETRTVEYPIEHGGWWTLYAWVHVENPHGVFASYNHSDDWDPLPAPPHDHGGH